MATQNASNCTISSLGGSATASLSRAPQASPGLTGAHKLEFRCSYNSSGTFRINLYDVVTKGCAWQVSKSYTVAYATVNGSTKYFINKTAAINVTGNGTWKIGGEVSWTVKDTTSIAVSFGIDLYGGGWGPSPSDGLYGSFTCYVPRVSSYTSCKAPTLTVDRTSAYMGDTMKVSYSGAAGGTNNSINGYTVQWSHDQKSWSNYGSKISTTSTSGSFNHAEVSVTGWMYFRMRTEGSAGSSYYSGWSNVVGCNYKTIGTPTNCKYIITEDGSNDETGYAGLSGSRRSWPAVSKTIKAQWTAAAGAASYSVELMRRNSADTGWETYATYSTSSTSYTFNLPNRSSFPGSRRNDCWYRVRAVRNGFYSSYAGPSWGFRRSATVRLYNGGWKNGAVWIYTGSKWVPAHTVHLYNSGWKTTKLY